MTLPQAQISSSSLANNCQTSRKTFTITFSCRSLRNMVLRDHQQRCCYLRRNVESKMQVTRRMDGFGWGSPTANLLEITWSPGHAEPRDLICCHSRPPEGWLGEGPHALVDNFFHIVLSCLSSCITSHSRSGFTPWMSLCSHNRKTVQQTVHTASGFHGSVSLLLPTCLSPETAHASLTFTCVNPTRDLTATSNGIFFTCPPNPPT